MTIEEEFEKKTKIADNIIDFLLITFLIIVALALGFYLGEYNNQVDESAIRSELFWTGCNGKTMYKVSELACSGSMRPTISCVNKVYYCSINQSEINRGDIIIYKNDNYQYGEGFDNIMHRVIEVHEDGVIAKGDANIDPDPDLILWKDIFGKVGRIE